MAHPPFARSTTMHSRLVCQNRHLCLAVQPVCLARINRLTFEPMVHTLALKVRDIWPCAAVVLWVAAILGTASCRFSPGSVAIPRPPVASFFGHVYVLPSRVKTLLPSLKPHSITDSVKSSCQWSLYEMVQFYYKWFQMYKDGHCNKCGVKFINRNHKKKNMRNPHGDEVRFGCSYLFTSSPPANHQNPSFGFAQKSLGESMMVEGFWIVLLKQI